MSEVLQHGPLIEVLWWSGCPSTTEFVGTLRPLLAKAGVDPDDVILREVHTDAEAITEGFVGSPTLRIDGRDGAPPVPDDPPALSCRVYRRHDGRVSPTPDPADIREALRAAALARSPAADRATPAPASDHP